MTLRAKKLSKMEFIKSLSEFGVSRAIAYRFFRGVGTPSVSFFNAVTNALALNSEVATQAYSDQVASMAKNDKRRLKKVTVVKSNKVVSTTEQALLRNYRTLTASAQNYLRKFVSACVRKGDL